MTSRWAPIAVGLSSLSCALGCALCAVLADGCSASSSPQATGDGVLDSGFPDDQSLGDDQSALGEAASASDAGMASDTRARDADAASGWTGDGPYFPPDAVIETFDATADTWIATEGDGSTGPSDGESRSDGFPPLPDGPDLPFD